MLRGLHRAVVATSWVMLNAGNTNLGSAGATPATIRDYAGWKRAPAATAEAIYPTGLATRNDYSSSGHTTGSLPPSASTSAARETYGASHSHT